MVTTTTSTTLEGVSVLSKQKGRSPDRFDIALSRRGVEVRRPGRPVQLLSWDRVSQWEIEEHPGYVLLTLRGAGAATPLVVPGWSLDDLEVLMRDVTADPGEYVADNGTPLVDQPANGATAAPAAPDPVAAAPTTRAPTTRPPSKRAAKATPLTPAAAPAKSTATAPAPALSPATASTPAKTTAPAPARATAPAPAPTQPRAERRRQRRRTESTWLGWKPVVTAVLLCALAAGVTLVLLQSAGVINWGFLGPVA